MRRLILEVSALILLVLVVGALSSAQMAMPDDNSTSKETDVYGSPIADPLQAQQADVSGSAQKILGHQLSGYISGTVLDQSGAASAGAEVLLSGEDQTSIRRVNAGGNGQFQFVNVAAGPFRLKVTSPGFAAREFSAVLRPGETYLVPPIMLVVAMEVTEVQVKVGPLTLSQAADIQIREQERQRIFGLVPNFYVTYENDVVPLNSKQKFRLAWKTTADPFTIVGAGALAGVQLATNSFDGYGQGAEGYFKRVGASYADVVTSTFIGSAILPSLLKQDPRYFYKGKGSTRSRLLYALASPVICKGDNMRWQPNYSNVAGAFASAGISYSYYPESDRNGAGLVIANSMIRLGEVAFEGVLQEFVIRRFTPRLRKNALEQP